MQTLTFPKTYIVWDLETTGLDKVNCHIVEIGAMVVKDGEIVSQSKWILDNKVPLNPEAMAINGITEEIIAAEGMDPREAIMQFLKMLSPEMPHITHNGIKFDIPWILQHATKLLELRQFEYEALKAKLEKNAIDTAAMMKGRKLDMNRKWNQSYYEWACDVMDVRAFGVKYNVGICCDELGIDKNMATQHRAGGDCILTNEIYKKLTA